VGSRRGAIRFAGYAARFDRLDGGGDIIRPGAFREALARSRSIPVLWQHKPGAVVGRVEAIGEDQRGLRVIGSVQAQGLGEDVAELVRSKRVDGLSFGYRVRRARKLDGVRELLSLDLVEVSLVSRPMQPLARVHAVEG
jgi:HK97 family phage prohead protease